MIPATARPALRLALLAAALVPAACRRDPTAGAAAVLEPTPLTIEEAEQRLGRPGVHFYDANPIEMYQRQHLPGARHLRYDQVRRRDLPDELDATLVFYCANEA